MEQKVDYEKQSLLNQVADYASRLANAEGKLTEKVIEVQELEKQLEHYRVQEVEEMNAE